MQNPNSKKQKKKTINCSSDFKHILDCVSKCRQAVYFKKKSLLTTDLLSNYWLIDWVFVILYIYTECIQLRCMFRWSMFRPHLISVTISIINQMHFTCIMSMSILWIVWHFLPASSSPFVIFFTREKVYYPY